MRVCSEESYLAQAGAGMGNMGEAALHRQPGVTDKRRSQLANAQAKKDHALIIRRAELRREYLDKVEAGEMRAPTLREHSEARAEGHPDNASTQAASRLLAKRAARKLALTN